MDSRGWTKGRYLGAWRERLVRASGIAGMPRPALRAIAAMSALALIFAAGMPWLSGATIPKSFPIIVGLVFLAHVFGLRMRLGNTTVNAAWGEAAVIVGFTVIHPSWIPAAVGVGALAGAAMRSLLGEPRSPLECVRASAALTISAALAAMVVVAWQINPRDLVPLSAFVLAVSAVIYTFGTLVMLALYLWARDREPVMGVMWGALRGSPIMITGNLALGLLAAMLWHTQEQRIFLLVLPPLLLLMYQHYSHRLREDEERRTWRAFALASRSLHRLDEVAVAQEGVRAARVLFAVRRVELAVIGSRTRYVLDGTSANVDVSVDDEVGEAHHRHDRNGPLEVTRSLEVAGGPVASLTMVLMRAGSWSTNDQHRLAAFGDALAAALHDAATHGALRDLHERTTYESLHDPLTRLLNRDALLDRGHARLRACPPDHAVALVLFDLDNFKAVNDTLGHLAGDELLQRTATRLADNAEPGELVARLGGDEFALLMTDLPATAGLSADNGNPLEVATTIAMRRSRALAANLAMPTEVAGVTLSAEVSAGVVVATAGPVDLIELLRRADIALYQAKGSGVRTVDYQPRGDDTSTDRLALVAELQSALSHNDQLDVVLMPTVDLPTGAPIGVEALTRWNHPRRGLLTPKDFVRAVEASDLLGHFTRYVLDRALGAAAAMAAAGLELPVSVNLSPRSLLDPHLPADLAQLLRTHRVPAENLVLEIIETVVLSPHHVTDQVLHELRKMGVRFAVDDFGTGFSSFVFLTRVTVDELKIDRTFVARMAESKEAAAIVRTVIDLGHRLGIRVIAEGIETAKQRKALVQLGCEAGQGFHFGKPVPASEIVDTLVRLRSSARPVRALRPGQAGLAQSG